MNNSNLKKKKHFLKKFFLKKLNLLKNSVDQFNLTDEDSETIHVKCISIKILQLSRRKSVQNLLKFTLFKFNIDFDISHFQLNLQIVRIKIVKAIENS